MKTEQHVLNNKLQSLPAAEHYEEIREKVCNNQLVIVEGNTGSGKSVVTPVAIAEALDGKVIVTQNRRVLCESISTFVEKSTAFQSATIGYHFKNGFKLGTKISFETVGTVLAKMNDLDSFLQGVACIVIDEIHEQTLDQFILLSQLKSVLKQNPLLKVVLMSATLGQDMKQRMLDFFATTSAVVSIETTNRYGILTRFSHQPCTVSLLKPNKPYSEIKNALLQEVTIVTQSAINHCCSHESVLVFLPGKAEIEKVYLNLKSSVDSPIYKLHGETNEEEKATMLQNKGKKVILATDVARSGITIENIKVVVSSGYSRVAHYDVFRNVHGLRTVLTDYASLRQEGGRTGRTCNGIHIILGSPSAKRASHAPSAFYSTDMAPLLLKYFNFVEKFDSFEWFQEPDYADLGQALTQLKQIEAVSVDEETEVMTISQIGKRILSMQLDIRLSKFLFTCEEFGIGSEGRIIVAAIHNRIKPKGEWGKFEKVVKDGFYVKRRMYENDLIGYIEAYKNSDFSEAEMQTINDSINRISIQETQEEHSREELIRLLQLATIKSYPARAAVYFSSNRAYSDRHSLHMYEGKRCYTGNRFDYEFPRNHRYHASNMNVEGVVIVALDVFNVDEKNFSSVSIDMPISFAIEHLPPLRQEALKELLHIAGNPKSNYVVGLEQVLEAVPTVSPVSEALLSSLFNMLKFS